jgi:outer membrane PBP1 activator LpoA protein
MIAMRNGSQSGNVLYASSRSAQGTAGPDFRLEMEGLQYSEIPMLAGSNPALMQQALTRCVTTTRWRVCMRWGDAWSLANHFSQMRQVPGFELNGNTGDLTATQDCVINRKLSWLKYQQGQIVPPVTRKQTGDAWELQARRWLEGKGLRFIAANVRAAAKST